MRVAVVGGAGVGKTAVLATLARSLARRGTPVVALDADPGVPLAVALGLDEDEASRYRSARGESHYGAEPDAEDWPDFLDRFGLDTPAGVRLALAPRVLDPEAGCVCCGLSPARVLAASDGSAAVVLADLADLADLVDLDDQDDSDALDDLADRHDLAEPEPPASDHEAVADLVLVVVDPRPESIEAGRRALERADAASLDAVVVANQVRDEEEQDRLQSAFADEEVVVVPHDPALAAAHGRCPDAAPESPGARSLAALAETLLPASPRGGRVRRALPLIGIALGLYALVPAYIGPQVNVSSTVELVDHVLPGAVVLAVSSAALFLSDASRRAANLMLVGGLLTFLAGFWMTATHLPLVAQSLRDEVSKGDAAYHSIPGFVVAILGVAWAANYWAQTAPPDIANGSGKSDASGAVEDVLEEGEPLMANESAVELEEEQRA